MLCLPAPTLLSARIPFAGFYGSIWEHSVDQHIEQSVENWREDDSAAQADLGVSAELATRLPLGELLFNVTAFRDAFAALAEAYVDEFAAWLGDTLGAEVAAEYEEMTSPSFYNFETDKVFTKLSLTALAEVRRRLDEDDPDALADAFRARFTSYDGFISFYPPELPTKPLAAWDHNELLVLVEAWVEHTESGTRLDDVLYDYRPGGLYEEVYRATDNAIDWTQLRELVAVAAKELA